MIARPWRCSSGPISMMARRLRLPSSVLIAFLVIFGVWISKRWALSDLKRVPTDSQISWVMCRSPISGTLAKWLGCSLNIEATSSLVMEFLAPLTAISPSRGTPPSIVQVSISVVLPFELLGGHVGCARAVLKNVGPGLEMCIDKVFVKQGPIAVHPAGNAYIRTLRRPVHLLYHSFGQLGVLLVNWIGRILDVLHAACIPFHVAAIAGGIEL